jgi:hypothetical protein
MLQVHPELREILEDPAAKSGLNATSPGFWFVVAALRDFVASGEEFNPMFIHELTALFLMQPPKAPARCLFQGYCQT